MNGDVPRHLVVAALDALEDGNQAEATLILLDALEDDRHLQGDVDPRPPVCALCGVRAWPGDFARHIYSAHHPVEPLELAA